MDGIPPAQAIAVDRRERQRFKASVPVTIMIDGRKIPAYTKDLSNRGVFFYVAAAQAAMIGKEFEFLLEFPPEITLAPFCRIRCCGRLLRKKRSSRSLSGIAAEILNYSILSEVKPES